MIDKTYLVLMQEYYIVLVTENSSFTSYFYALTWLHIILMRKIINILLKYINSYLKE